MRDGIGKTYYHGILGNHFLVQADILLVQFHLFVIWHVLSYILVFEKIYSPSQEKMWSDTQQVFFCLFTKTEIFFSF